MTGHVLKQGQVLFNGLVHRPHFMGTPLADSVHNFLSLGFLPKLVKGVGCFSQFGQQRRGRSFHDNAAFHALSLHIQAIEQNMDETDRIAVENEKRYFFHVFLSSQPMQSSGQYLIASSTSVSG